MATMIDVEVWVLIDEAGDYAVAKSEDSLSESYENDIQPVADAGCTRRVKVTLRIPQPEPLCLEGTVPEEANNATLTVAS